MENQSLDAFIMHYKNLTHDNPTIRSHSNSFLNHFIQTDQVWSVAKSLITSPHLSQYRLLGAQQLYSKLKQSLNSLSLETQSSIKDFIFTQISDPHLPLNVLKNIASCGSLVACSLIINHQASFLYDLFQAMDESREKFIAGLYVLFQIPSEMRDSSQPRSKKKIVIDGMLQQWHSFLVNIFSRGLDEEDLTSITLETMEHWIMIGFPVLTVPKLVEKVVQLINQPQLMSQCSKVLRQALKCWLLSKFQTIFDNFDAIGNYTDQQVLSLNIIINFFRSIKQFFTQAVHDQVESSKVEDLFEVVNNLLLRHTAIIYSDYGVDLIDLILEMLESGSLTVSHLTLEFWEEFIDKQAKTKNSPENQQTFMTIVAKVFSIVLARIKIPTEAALQQIRTDDDETIDNTESISFRQYRQQISSILNSVYRYLTSKSKDGSQIFFNKIIEFLNIEQQQPLNLIGIELVLYSVLSIQDKKQPQYLDLVIKLIQFLLPHVIKMDIPRGLAYQILRVMKQFRESIKDGQIYYSCIDFCFSLLGDSKLASFSVDTILVLMSAKHSHPEGFLQKIISFYFENPFQKISVAEKMLDSILSYVLKIEENKQIVAYMQVVVKAIVDKANVTMYNNPNIQTFDQYHSILTEINILFKNLKSFFINFEQDQYFMEEVSNLSQHGIVIISSLVHSYLGQFNYQDHLLEVNFCVKVAKQIIRVISPHSYKAETLQCLSQLLNLPLKICQSSQLRLFNQYSVVFQLITTTLSHFQHFPIPEINEWITANSEIINAFFFCFIGDKVKEIDPDIIRQFLAFQEGILQYKLELYLQQENHKYYFELALFALENIVQSNLQRQTIMFIDACFNKQKLYSQQSMPVFSVCFNAALNLSHACLNIFSSFLKSTLNDKSLRQKELLCLHCLQNDNFKDLTGETKELLSQFLGYALESEDIRQTFQALSQFKHFCKKHPIKQQDIMKIELKLKSWRKLTNTTVN